MRTRRAVSPVSHKSHTPRMRRNARVSELISKLYSHSSSDWSRATRTIILKRFKAAVEQVPAYRKFLKKNGLSSAVIGQLKEISLIPPITKNTYLREYPWDTLCREHALTDDALVLTATSGSTGAPFYIPRADDVHETSMVFHRLFVERSGLDKKKPTLVIVAFGMGVWIGGVLTYEAFRRISEGGWPLSLITPGVNKKEIFETLAHVGKSYEQIILCGYPPFVKDVIDDGFEHGVHWKQWDMRIVCAAEAFSERFRDYLMHKTGMKDPYRSVMNIYGSAELGTMATETPLSILLRRLALAHPALYERLFSEAHRLPTLAQFVPDLVAFEAGEEGQVYVTGSSALPFIRYDIGDQGGVFTYDEAVSWCREVGIDLAVEVTRSGIEHTVMQLPFVYLYERTDLSTKLYGAIMYPEHVKKGLQHPSLEKAITGRFTMTTENDADHNEYLEINIELRAGVKRTKALEATIIERVMKSLSASSAEYKYLLGSIHDKVVPRIIFWPHEHPTYFAPGVKQKWVKRQTDPTRVVR